MNDTPIAKHIADAGAALLIGTTLLGWLPTIAAVLGIIWYGMQMYTWVENRLKKK